MDETPTSQFVYFTITGEALTRIARDLFLEGEPNRAWRLLAFGLRGDDLDRVARRVLDGDAKLVGDSTHGVSAEPDDATEHKQRARWTYAGRVRVRGAWYRPRAIVTDYGPEDAAFATRTTRQSYIDGNAFRINPQWAQARTEAYAYPGEIVVHVQHPEGRFRRYGVEHYESYHDIIFEPCNEPPHWWPEPRDASEAFRLFEEAGRQLEVEGHANRFGPYNPENRVASAKPVTKEEAEEQFARERADVERQDRVHRALCAGWRKTILERNGDDSIDLVDIDGNVVAAVPRKPFEAYALERTKLRDKVAWEPVCPSGLKLQNDSRFHTDWYVGAGYTLEQGYPYDSPLHAAAVYTMSLVQRRYASFACGVVVDAGSVTGVVGSTIVVLPDLAPERLPKLLSARGVITQAGGQLAHLAQIALERNITIMLVPDALERYPDGTKLSLLPDEGKIKADLEQR